MKMIYVSGNDDFAALDFEKHFNGKTVKEIIDSEFSNHTSSIEFETDEGNFEIELYNFGEVDPEFINFVNNQILDYDQSKHTNFYFEDETIKA